MNKTAADVMTTEVATVDADWPVDRLLELFANRGISGAPVVDEDGQPVGVVSLADVARNGAVSERRSREERAAFFRESLERLLAREEVERFHPESDDQAKVGDIMTPVVFAVEENASVQEVAAMMTTGRIHRVLVKRGGKLTGIVSALDLLPLVRDM